MGLTNDAIDVVVPVHNEGATIRSTLEEFYRAAAESHIRIRFVVAEDASVDDTVAVLKLLERAAAEIDFRPDTQRLFARGD